MRTIFLWSFIISSLLPALVALPVFALVRRWSSHAGGGLWLPTCAALGLIVLGGRVTAEVRTMANISPSR